MMHLGLGVGVGGWGAGGLGGRFNQETSASVGSDPGNVGLSGPQTSQADRGRVALGFF